MINITYCFKYTFLLSFLGHISKDTEVLIQNDRCGQADIQPGKTGKSYLVTWTTPQPATEGKRPITADSLLDLALMLWAMLVVISLWHVVAVTKVLRILFVFHLLG